MSISKDQRYYLKLKALYYYYEKGYTQTKIAKSLNISRVTLGRLLEEAKAEGMIKFEIVDVRGSMKTLELEEKLKTRFGLTDIKLVNCHDAQDDQIPNRLAYEAADYLEQRIHSHMKIGLTWGRTLSKIIDTLPSNKSIQDLSVYTLVGSTSQSVDFQPNVLAQRIIDKYNGTASILTAPFMCQSEELCQAIKKEPAIQSILEASHDLDMTLVGIGEEPIRNADHLSDYPFEPSTINELVDAHAVGDICGNFFDINGQLCDTPIKNRIVSIDIHDLPSHKQVIGIGGGQQKVRSIIGALNGGYLHTLITDVQTAEKVLELTER